MCPATVDDRDGEPVQVLTVTDAWRFLRWIAIPVVTGAAGLIVGGTNMRNEVQDHGRRLAAESLSIVDVRRDMGNLYGEVAKLHGNLDSSLVVSRQILRAVTRPK